MEDEREKYGLLKLIYGNGNLEKSRIKALEILNSDNEMVMLAGIELLSNCGKLEDVELLKKLTSKIKNNDMLEAIRDTVISLTKIKS